MERRSSSDRRGGVPVNLPRSAVRSKGRFEHMGRAMSCEPRNSTSELAPRSVTDRVGERDPELCL